MKKANYMQTAKVTRNRIYREADRQRADARFSAEKKMSENDAVAVVEDVTNTDDYYAPYFSLAKGVR